MLCSNFLIVNLSRLTTELASFASNLFFIQFATSALGICGSVYCVAFVSQICRPLQETIDLFCLQDVSENVMERTFHFMALGYNISEIFMITYLGNEIMLSSDRLSYCLFESDWVDQPQSTKKIIIIFGEFLKQPHQLVIGKLYPLTLETFTRVGWKMN